MIQHLGEHGNRFLSIVAKFPKGLSRDENRPVWASPHVGELVVVYFRLSSERFFECSNQFVQCSRRIRGDLDQHGDGRVDKEFLIGYSSKQIQESIDLLVPSLIAKVTISKYAESN